MRVGLHLGGHFYYVGAERAQKELILRYYGSQNQVLFDEFGGRLRKVPTCVWIEPARADCMLGLSDFIQKSVNKLIKSEISSGSPQNLPKVHKLRHKVAQWGTPGVPRAVPRLQNASKNPSTLGRSAS